MKECAAIVEDAARDLGGGFADDQLVSGDQSDDRVRVLLDELEQFGVDDDGMSVEPGELDHRIACLPKRLSAEKNGILRISGREEAQERAENLEKLHK